MYFVLIRVAERPRTDLVAVTDLVPTLAQPSSQPQPSLGRPCLGWIIHRLPLPLKQLVVGRGGEGRGWRGCTFICTRTQADKRVYTHTRHHSAYLVSRVMNKTGGRAMKTSHVRTKCCHVPKRTTRSKRKMRKKLKLYLPLKKSKGRKTVKFWYQVCLWSQTVPTDGAVEVALVSVH